MRKLLTHARALTVAALALTGCKGVGPDYHGPPPPDRPDPAKYKNADLNSQWKLARPDHTNPP